MYHLKYRKKKSNKQNNNSYLNIIQSQLKNNLRVLNINNNISNDSINTTENNIIGNINSRNKTNDDNDDSSYITYDDSSYITYDDSSYRTYDEETSINFKKYNKTNDYNNFSSIENLNVLRAKMKEELRRELFEEFGLFKTYINNKSTHEIPSQKTTKEIEHNISIIPHKETNTPSLINHDNTYSQHEIPSQKPTKEIDHNISIIPHKETNTPSLINHDHKIVNQKAALPDNFNWKLFMSILRSPSVKTENNIIEYFRTYIYYNSELYIKYYRAIYNTPDDFDEKTYVDYLINHHNLDVFPNENVPFEKIYAFFKQEEKTYGLNESYYTSYYNINLLFIDIFKERYMEKKSIQDMNAKEVCVFYLDNVNEYKLDHKYFCMVLKDANYREKFEIKQDVQIDIFSEYFNINFDEKKFTNLIINKNIYEYELDQGYYKLLYNINEDINIDIFLKTYSNLSFSPCDVKNIFDFYSKNKNDYGLGKSYYMNLYNIDLTMDIDGYYEIYSTKIKCESNNYAIISKHYNDNKNNLLFMDSFYKKVYNISSDFDLALYCKVNQCFFPSNHPFFNNLIEKDPFIIYKFYNEEISLDDLYDFYNKCNSELKDHTNFWDLFEKRYTFIDSIEKIFSEKEKRYYFMIYDFKQLYLDYKIEKYEIEIGKKKRIETEMIKEIKEVHKTRKVTIKKKNPLLKSSSSNQSSSALLKLMAMLNNNGKGGSKLLKDAPPSLSQTMMASALNKGSSAPSYKIVEEEIDEPYVEYDEVLVPKETIIEDPIYKTCFYENLTSNDPQISYDKSTNTTYFNNFITNNFVHYFQHRFNSLYEHQIFSSFNKEINYIIYMPEKYQHIEFFLQHLFSLFGNKISYTIACCKSIYKDLIYLKNKYNIQISKLPYDKIKYNDFNNLMLNKDFWSQFSGSKFIFSKPSCFIKDKNIYDVVERVNTYYGIHWPFISGIRAGGLGEFFIAKKEYIMQSIDQANKKSYSITTQKFIKYCYGDQYPFDVVFSHSLVEKNKYLFNNIIINNNSHIQTMIEEGNIIFGDKDEYIKPKELFTIFRNVI